MKKNIKLIILGIIVLMLSILGFIKYEKSNSINIGFGIGSIGIGPNKTENDMVFSKEKIKNGVFVECNDYEDYLQAKMWIEFKNGKMQDIVYYKLYGKVPNEELKNLTKKEIENNIISLICSKDKNYPLCSNIKTVWKNNTITMTFNVNHHNMYNGEYDNLTINQFVNKLNSPKEICKITNKGYTSEQKILPAGTYYNKYNNSKKVKDTTNNKPVQNEEKKSPTDENSVNKMCLQLATGNYDSKRSEGVNYTFYCNKKVINPTITISIVGQSAKDKVANYTIDSYKKYLKDRFCDKYHLSNCKYNEIEGGTKEVSLIAECKTNYNGLEPSTVRELFPKGQSIEETMVSVCK